jgi:hypothetical protein
MTEHVFVVINLTARYAVAAFRTYAEARQFRRKITDRNLTTEYVIDRVRILTEPPDSPDGAPLGTRYTLPSD